MRKRTRLFALALALTLALTGCGQREVMSTETPDPTPTPEPTAAPAAEEVGFALPCYPGGSFHPISGSNRLNLTLAPLLYRGLFALDRTFSPQYDLCESDAVSADAKVWTFHLREATFSDGSPLTAAEAAASLNAARRSERYRLRLEDVTAVAAEGERDVVVTLSRPNGALPALLDVPIVKETDDPLRPLGTGPYYLAGEEGTPVLLAREGAAVPRTQVPLRGVSSGDDLVYAFETREISLVDTDLTGTNMPGYSGRQEVTDYPTTTLLYVGCNMASGACREEAVRRAVALALDREQVVELLLGHGRATALPVHPDSLCYDETLAQSAARDPQKALELLAQAGWSPDEEGTLTRWRSPLTLKLIVNQENIYKVTVAAALGDMLTQLGCAVTLVKLPWDDYLSALEQGDFDLYLAEVVLTGDFGLEGLLGSQGALNYGGCRDAVTDLLLEEYRAARGEARTEAAAALWEHLVQTAPMVPLCFKNGSLLTQWGQIRGMAPTQQDLFAGLEDWVVTGG